MSTTLYHSQKGQTWKNHKYIAIKNGRYIYPVDVAGEGSARQLRREAREETRKEEAKLARERLEPKHSLDKVSRKKINDSLYEYNMPMTMEPKTKGSHDQWKYDEIFDRLIRPKSRQQLLDIEVMNRQDQNKAVKKVSKMHRNGMESGNDPSGKNKIYRQSDVNETKNKRYSMKNKVSKAIKSFGKKGKSFLASLFKKK